METEFLSGFSAGALLNIVLPFLLVLCAFIIIMSHRLMTNIILLAIFSLLMAALYLVLDAPDVAITEAAVGAGVSTALLLATLVQSGTQGRERTTRRVVIPLVVVLITGTALVYTTVDMPAFGDPLAPAQTHVAPYYLDHTEQNMGIPNVVTAILASYRGYDTLGETAVVFLAALAVLLLLGGNTEEDEGEDDN